MVRLRQVSVEQPGWSRRRAGRGFAYRDEAGQLLPDEAKARVKALAIPPAWREVWICPHPNGHLQAVGTDDAGRRQYLYHPAWREQRDAEKFARVQELGRRLPQVRRTLAEHLGPGGDDLRTVCALAVTLLDLGCFRVGNDEYTEEYGSFGLTTLLREHVRSRGTAVRFSYTGKAGIEQAVEITDPSCAAAIRLLNRRRSGPDTFLCHRHEGQWRCVDGTTLNDYLREVTGLEVSAKDFRTWHGSVVAAAALARTGPADSETEARSAVARAMEEVAEHLGNTPAVARSAYVDPRVLTLYERGRTMELPDLPAGGRANTRTESIERAYLDLVDRHSKR